MTTTIATKKTYPGLGNFRISLSATGDRLDFIRLKRDPNNRLKTIQANSLGHPLIERIQAAPGLDQQCEIIDQVIGQLYSQSKRQFYRHRRGSYNQASQWPYAVEEHRQEYLNNQSAIRDAEKIRDELDVNQGDRVANCKAVVEAHDTIKQLRFSNRRMLNYQEVTTATETALLMMEAKRTFFEHLWLDLCWPLYYQEQNYPHKCEWLPETLMEAV